MDPEQLQIILGYAFFVGVASLILRYREPELSRIRIAFITGGVLPLLALGLAVMAFLRWVNAAPLPNDTDHHAWASSASSSCSSCPLPA